jgi:hypothetical protein
MPVFQITPLTSNRDELEARIRGMFPQKDWFELQHRAGFLISYKGTTVDLSHELGITSPEGSPKGPTGPAMVTSIGSYYGVANTSMWEWLKIQFESP